MKAVYTGAVALMALALGSCGDKMGSNDAAANATAAPLEQIAAPNGGDWTQVVEATPEGGFRMGNPNAKVKLVEYGSLTCPHCADFSEKGVPVLESTYVKSGQVSYEMRNYVRDPIDLAASLLSRCGGAAPYFKLTDQLFAAQREWLDKFSGLDQAAQQRLSAMQPSEQTGELARIGGLIDFMKVRGVPEAKAKACLADKAAMDKLVSMANVANTQYQLPGTPTFLINGNVVPDTASWDALEPALREALK